MRLFLLTSLILFLSNNIFSQVIKEYDTLYVWAESGLNIRIDRLPDSEVLRTVPYGSSVLSVKHIDSWSQDTHPITEIPEVSINNKEYPAVTKFGKHIEVQYKDIVGFVHSGYLSKLPTLSFEQEIKPYAASENIKSYFDEEFGLLKTILTDSSSVNASASHIFLYNNGFMIDQRYSPNGNGWEFSYLFIDISMNEVYLLLNVIKSFEKQYKTALSENAVGEFCPYTFNSEAITLQTGLFEITEIRKVGNYILMKMEGGN